MTDRTHSGQVVEKLLTVARLLREPGLARLYTYVLRVGEVTIDDIVDALNLPRARAISERDTAVELGVLTRIHDRPDHRFTASPILLSVEVDGETQTVTPTLIDAVGRAPGDQDLQHLLDRYGIDTLAVALSYAIPYAEGTMSERVAVRELGLQPAFGIAVLQSLQEVVIEMEVYDLKYTGTMTAAPRLALEENVLAEAQTYDDPYHRAAALLWHLISTHVFEDANKRTAWTVAMEYLDRHGIDPALPEDEVARVVRRHGLFTVDELARWLETGEIDTDRLPED